MFIEQQLNEMQEQLRTLSSFMMMMIPDLTNKKNVQHFLQITRQTMATYIKDGIIKDGVHFYLDEKDNEVFIPEEIIKLRAFGVRKQPSKIKDTAAIKVLEKMGISI